VDQDGADRVRLLVRLEVEQVVCDGAPHADRLVRLAGVGDDDVPEDRLGRLWNFGIGDGDEVVMHGHSRVKTKTAGDKAVRSDLLPRLSFRLVLS